jgi:hypothetical protein
MFVLAAVSDQAKKKRKRQKARKRQRQDVDRHHGREEKNTKKK